MSAGQCVVAPLASAGGVRARRSQSWALRAAQFLLLCTARSVGMLIECRTTSAAAYVLFILVDAHLRPGQQFHMIGPCLPDPPIRFDLHVHPVGHVMRRLRAIPDIRIEREHSA
jgi:hypothetical protein